MTSWTIHRHASHFERRFFHSMFFYSYWVVCCTVYLIVWWRDLGGPERDLIFGQDLAEIWPVFTVAEVTSVSLFCKQTNKLKSVSQMIVIPVTDVDNSRFTIQAGRHRPLACSILRSFWPKKAPEIAGSSTPERLSKVFKTLSILLITCSFFCGRREFANFLGGVKPPSRPHATPPRAPPHLCGI